MLFFKLLERIFNMKMHCNIIGFVGLLFLVLSCKTKTPGTPDLISEIISKSEDSLLKAVWSRRDHYNLQISYSQIQTHENGSTDFKTWMYPEQAPSYFYPASTVKLPLAILAMQKLRTLQKQGVPITHETPFKLYNSSMQIVKAVDSTHEKGWLTIGHLIKKIFLVSDNEAYNYLYDFLGRDSINNVLKSKGIEGFRISHKLLTKQGFEGSPHIIFFSESLDTVYHQKPLKNQDSLVALTLKGLNKGKGFMQGKTYVKEPMDFSNKNYMSLKALDQLLKRLIFPEAFPSHLQFDLDQKDYTFLSYWMSRVPTEISHPNYDKAIYYDSYGKFLMYGDTKGKMTPDIRLYNKIGLAYGTVTDAAYITNAKGVQFFLAASLLVNENQIFNDDVYEYDTVGIPFLAGLGRVFYNYELHRN